MESCGGDRPAARTETIAFTAADRLGGADNGGRRIAEKFLTELKESRESLA
jgi:hypothetical protein